MRQAKLSRLPIKVSGMYLLLLAMLFALSAFFSSGALAQGLPLVPDPITSPELSKYADILGLSVQQRLSLLSVHDEYRQRYREFEDRDVRKLQDQLLTIVSRFRIDRFDIPPRTELEAIVDQYKRIISKAHGIDRSLFNDMAAMLAEEQMPRLDRARIARELRVYRDMVRGFAGEFNRGARANLSEMAASMKPLPEFDDEFERVRDQYEAGLLSRSKSIYSVLTQVSTVILDTIDSLNIRNMTIEQMMALGQNQDVINNLQSTFDEASKPFQAAAHDVSQLNLRSLRQMLSLLSFDDAAELRDRYFRSAYREGYDGPGKFRERYRKAMALDAVSEDLRQTLREQLESFSRQDDVIADNIANLLESSREYRTFLDLSQNRGRVPRERIEELQQRRATLHASADASLNALLGEELLAKLDQPKKSKPAEVAKQIAVQVAVGAGSDGVAVQHDVRVSNETIPSAEPLTVAEIKQLIKQLELDEGTRLLVMSIYDDYRAEYEKQRKVQPTEAAAGDQTASTDASDKTAGADLKNQRAIFETLQQLDERFFDDIALAIGADSQGSDAALQRHRTLRSRSAAIQTTQQLSHSYGQDEAYLDLVRIVLVTGELSREAVASLSDPVAAYESLLTPLIADRLNAARDVRRRYTTFRRISDEGKGAAEARKAAEFAMEKYAEANKRVRAINQQIIALNRDSLTQMLRRLSANAASDARLRYNRAAYPDIFNDEHSPEKYIQAVLEMPDLQPHQVDQVNQIVADFRAAYYELCDRMIELRKDRDFDFTQMPKREDMEREIALERARIDRTEVSNRARLRLQLVLNEQQQQQIPDLRFQ